MCKTCGNDFYVHLHCCVVASQEPQCICEHRMCETCSNDFCVHSFCTVCAIQQERKELETDHQELTHAPHGIEMFAPFTQVTFRENQPSV